MKKIKVILNVQASESEDINAVLKGYFASHNSARKVDLVEIFGEQKLQTLDAEIIEETSEEKPAIEIEKTVEEKAFELVNSKTNAQLKSFKAKYKIETENDKNEVLKPAIVEFLVKNLDATFE